MFLRSSMTGSCALALALCGCDGGGFGTEMEFTRLDPVCVESVRVEGQDVLRVEARFDTCLSSSCDSLQEASCRLTETADGVLLEGTAIVEQRRGNCTADCGGVTVTCELALSEAGTYEVRGSEHTIEHEFPNGPISCRDDL